MQKRKKDRYTDRAEEKYSEEHKSFWRKSCACKSPDTDLAKHTQQEKWSNTMIPVQGQFNKGLQRSTKDFFERKE